MLTHTERGSPIGSFQAHQVNQMLNVAQRTEKQRISFHLRTKKKLMQKVSGSFWALWCVFLAFRHSICWNIILLANDIHPVLGFLCVVLVFSSGSCVVSSINCITKMTVPTLRYNIVQCRLFFGFRHHSYWLNTYCTQCVRLRGFCVRRKIRAQNFCCFLFFVQFLRYWEVCLVNCKHRKVLTPLLIRTYLLRVINHLIYLLCTFFFMSSWSRRTSAFFFFAVVVRFSFFLAAMFIIAYSDESRSNLKTSVERQLDNEKVFCNYSN